MFDRISLFTTYLLLDYLFHKFLCSSANFQKIFAFSSSSSILGILKKWLFWNFPIINYHIYVCQYILILSFCFQDSEHNFQLEDKVTVTANKPPLAINNIQEVRLASTCSFANTWHLQNIGWSNFFLSITMIITQYAELDFSHGKIPLPTAYTSQIPPLSLLEIRYVIVLKKTMPRWLMTGPWIASSLCPVYNLDVRALANKLERTKHNAKSHYENNNFSSIKPKTSKKKALTLIIIFFK